MRADVLFLTQNLELGGSQRQLVMLAGGLARRGAAITVAVFYPGGPLWRELEASGVQVVSLDKRGRWDLPAFLGRLARLVMRTRPRIIHGYLDVPNLLALLTRPFARGARIVWGVRSSHVDWTRFDRLTQLAFAAGCRLARFADLIVLNSSAGRAYHAQLGYPAARMVVVPNGIDTTTFAPDPVARRAVRAEWGIGADEVLVGLVARIDPLKGHDTFLHAAAILAGQLPRVRFVCVGSGEAAILARMQGLAERLGVAQRVTWAGARRDMTAVYSALDLAVSASIGEGFSNVIGEAMAAGVPCIVTDTGDSAWIVGDDALVIPADDASALARAMAQALPRLGAELSATCRGRIAREFGVERLVDRTIDALGLAVGARALRPRAELAHG